MALAGLSKSEKDEHCVCFAALALHDGGAEINADSIKAMVEATKTATFSEKLSMAGNALVSFHLPAPAAEAIKAPSLQERTTRDLNAVTTDFIPSVEFEINRFPTRRRSTPVA